MLFAFVHTPMAWIPDTQLQAVMFLLFSLSCLLAIAAIGLRAARVALVLTLSLMLVAPVVSYSRQIVKTHTPYFVCTYCCDWVIWC